MRDSIVFYRSFLEAIEELPAKDFKNCVLAILRYGLDDQIPTAKGIEKTVYLMAKPQIDKNNQRYENGKTGGRPKNQTKTKEKPNDNQTKTKSKKEKPNVNDNDNVNVNDNDNVNVSVNGDYILPSECARLDGNFNDEFQSFCAKWKISIDINSPLIADLDFIKLDKAYSESKTLLQDKEKAPYAHTLSWVVKNASSICAGKYKDRVSISEVRQSAHEKSTEIIKRLFLESLEEENDTN